MGKMPTAYLHLFLKGAMSAPIGRVTCSVWDKKSHPSDVNRQKNSISWPLPLSGLLMSSHGLKKPLMLANKDAIPNTVMPMM